MFHINSCQGRPLDPLGDKQGGEIMGRPKLGETALRRHVLTVRLNDGEHEDLRRQGGKGAAAGRA